VSPPRTLHRGAILSVAFSPYGNTLASSSQDGMVQFWNATNGLPMAPPITGHHRAILSVAYNPVRDILATGSADGTVQLWDAATHKQVATLNGHTGAVYSVAFSRNGTMLAAGSADHTVLIWDVAPSGPIMHSLAGSSGPFLAHYLCTAAQASLARAARSQYVRQAYQIACS